jgi:outer membrane protein OmpA-like peptidoglycan-associated protein
VAKTDDGLGDRDNDGIFDRDDKCPDEMENYNGVDDEDGCPEQDRPMVIEKDSELVPLQPIEFEFDKDVLRKSAYPILAAVVKALNDNPGLTLIEVQGHTDEQGNDAYNLDLSIRRAATVMRYLRDAGIAESRLTSQGYGETMPVDPRHTQAAYTLNRRVAFIIKQRD